MKNPKEEKIGKFYRIKKSTAKKIDDHHAKTGIKKERIFEDAVNEYIEKDGQGRKD